MSEPECALDAELAEIRLPLWRRLFRLKDVSFYLMIGLTWAGILYSASDQINSRWYWHWLIPGFGIISLLLKWRQTEPTVQARARLVLHEALYWGGVLGLVYLLYALASPTNDWLDLFDERQVSFLAAFLLAASTYLAGLNHDWRLCVVGAFILIGGVINVAFSNLAPLLVWIGLGIVALYFVWTWLYHRWRRGEAVKTVKTQDAV